ncbi:MAG: hypothetical protein J0L92_03760 [Deltaproteobacteria bacterium]|nr:hypothetical protein [Deltaproteobacteria bacterium]
MPIEAIDSARMAASLTGAYERMVANARRPWPTGKPKDVPTGPAEWKHDVRHAVLAVLPGATARHLRGALLSPQEVVDLGGPARAAASVAAKLFGVSEGSIRMRRDRAADSTRRSYTGDVRSARPLVAALFRALGCDDASANVVALASTTIADALREGDEDDRTEKAREVLAAVTQIGRDIQPLIDAADAGLPGVAESKAHHPDNWDMWLKPARSRPDPRPPAPRAKAGGPRVHRRAGT